MADVNYFLQVGDINKFLWRADNDYQVMDTLFW